MANGIEEDIRDWLTAQGTVTDSAAKIGALPDSPVDCVAFISYGGPQPITAMGQANVVNRIMYLQILVRKPVDEYEAGVSLMEAIYAKVVQAAGVSVNGNTYDKIIAISEPMPLRLDNEDSPIQSLNIEAWRHGLGS
jgi:hypothetical protein